MNECVRGKSVGDSSDGNEENAVVLEIMRKTYLIEMMMMSAAV